MFHSNLPEGENTPDTAEKLKRSLKICSLYTDDAYSCQSKRKSWKTGLQQVLRKLNTGYTPDDASGRRRWRQAKAVSVAHPQGRGVSVESCLESTFLLPASKNHTVLFTKVTLWGQH